MKVIECRTIAGAHAKLVNYVFWNGQKMTTEDGQSCIEAEPVTVTIHHPVSEDDRDWVNPSSPAQIQKVLAYVEQIFRGASGFEYTYNERLMYYSRSEHNSSIISCAINDLRQLTSRTDLPIGVIDKLKDVAFSLDIAEDRCMDMEEPINQINQIIDHLTDELFTRRAVAITWYPWKDPITQHVPCLQWMQFKVRKQRFGFLLWLIGKKPILDMYLLFRSEDVLGAFGQNAAGMASLLQYVADSTDCAIGKIEHIVTIPHLYPTTNAQELKRMTKC